MTDRPILFSSPMILALLARRKRQTRRILKPEPYSNGYRFDGRDFLCHNDYLPPSALLMDRGKGKNRYTISNMEDGPEGMSGVYIGDRFWCREVWHVSKHFDKVKPSDLSRDTQIRYEATDFPPVTILSGRFRPGMFMPRWASRITLSVIDVKIERLLEISEADAIAEGIVKERVIVGATYAGGIHSEISADRYFTMIEAIDGDDGFESGEDAYFALWDHINGKGAADKNPWVSAYTFDPIFANIDAKESA